MTGASPLEGLLKKIIKGLGKKERLTAERITEIWREVAGDRAAGHSKPVSLHRCTLIIHVDGSAWLYELTVKKKEMMQTLEKRLARKIKDIRFRIGDI